MNNSSDSNNGAPVMSHHATIVPTDNSELDSGEIWPLAIVLPHRQSKDWDASDANVRVYRQRTDSKHSPASTSTDSQQVIVVGHDQGSSAMKSVAIVGSNREAGEDEEGEPELQPPSAQLLALFDKSSNSVRFFPYSTAQPIRLTPHIATSGENEDADQRPGADTSQEKTAAMKRSLVQAFGSYRQKRAQAQVLTSIQTQRSVVHASSILEDIVAEDQRKDTDDATDDIRFDPLGRLPPHRPGVTSAQEAYPLEHLIDPQDRKDFHAKNLMKAATSKGLSSRKSIQKALGIENIPQFILKRITAVADAINAEQADLICYLSVLIALYFSPRNLNPFSIDDSKAPEPHSTTGAPGGSSDKSSKAVNVLCRTISEKTGASPGMAQRLLKTYYMEVSDKRIWSRSQGQDTALRLRILIAGLHLDGYTLDVAEYSSLLQIEQVKLKTDLRGIGCVFRKANAKRNSTSGSASSNSDNTIAQLSLPFRLPQVKRPMAPRR